MQIKIEVLQKGDDVIGFSNDKIAIKRASGEVEIFTLIVDEEGLPRLYKDSVLLTFGTSKKVSVQKKGIEVGTF